MRPLTDSEYINAMGNTDDILNDIRRQADARPEPLAEARTRLGLVQTKAIAFPGGLRTYASGSLPQHTFIHPVSDGDGGLVLDRRVYPALGPEGDGETPKEVTEELCGFLGPALRQEYPKARCGTSKRGPKIWFGQPIDGQDPTVDLVVALTRRVGEGLWIPNLHTNTWEASHPERHVELFTSGSQSLRRTRRRVIRLLKAWNKQYNEPAFSSHNLTVWAWEFVEPGMGVAAALKTVLTKAAARVASGQATRDPAGVSKNVQLLISRTTAARRLNTAATSVTEALEHDGDREVVRTALSRMFFNYLDAPTTEGLAHKISALRRKTPVTTSALGLGGPSTSVPATRAFGVPGSRK
ncbi:hypothetical protein [Actinomadura welshii]|uniref:hypothetical protein n=1 Tax=Actinomadura welshii TaxID=3103817 RepID=UPI0003AD1013|nr:hypothetical protein [Actinomadura madurae]